jgi:hypothetical protein
MALTQNGYDPHESVQALEARFKIASDTPPTVEQVEYQRVLRGAVDALAQDLNQRVFDCREKSLALTKLEEALMWAGKAIFK